jgi:hypothetical protein
MRGAIGDQEARPGGVIHIVRHFGHPLGSGDSLGRVTAGAGGRKHPVTRFEVLNIGATGDDVASNLLARGEGRIGLGLVGAGDLQGIGKVDATRPHLDVDLARLRRIEGNLFQAQRIEPAMPMTNDCFDHDAFLLLMCFDQPGSGYARSSKKSPLTQPSPASPILAVLRWLE